jgi:pimeloyl-ACP methyl ester carboxylesterase
METVTSADGTTIAYDRSGEGPPVIGLHGTGVRRSIWSLLAGQFDDGTLLAPDRRGRGDSGDTASYDFEREVEDVQALVEACEREPVLFGSSFGGLLAMEAAQSADIAGLALYEPPLPQATLDERDTPEQSLADQTAEYIDAGDPEAAARTFFTQATGAESVEHWPIWPECIEFAQTIPRECRVVEAFELSTVPTEYPTLLCTGTESPDYLQAGIDELAGMIPEHTIVTLDGVGHAGVATAPGQVAKHLSSFLN